MVPRHWEYLDALPRSVNFKTDYGALASLDAARCAARQTEAQASAPDSPDTLLRQRWSHYTSAEAHDRNETWRSGGGSSVSALSLLVDLEERLGRELPVDWFHPDMRPAELRERLRGLAGEAIPVRKPAPGPQYVIFPALYGIREGSYRLIQDLKALDRARVIEYPNHRTLPLREVSMAWLVEQIRPQVADLEAGVHLIGICTGSYPAHEVACWLSSQGKQPRHITYLDNITADEELKPSAMWREMWRRKAVHLPLLRVVRALSRSWYRQLILAYARLRPRGEAEARDRLLNRTHTHSYLPGRVTLIRCQDRRYHPSMGWDRYVAELTIVPVPFVHKGMFDLPEKRQTILKIIRSEGAA